jgi:hypothetical protein
VIVLPQEGTNALVHPQPHGARELAHELRLLRRQFSMPRVRWARYRELLIVIPATSPAVSARHGLARPCRTRPAFQPGPAPTARARTGRVPARADRSGWTTMHPPHSLLIAAPSAVTAAVRHRAPVGRWILRPHADASDRRRMLGLGEDLTEGRTKQHARGGAAPVGAVNKRRLVGVS